MKTDNELQREVIAELSWEPSIRNEDVAVAVKGGVVTLAGTLDSYAQRYAAERAVERIKGAQAVVNDLIVKLGDSASRSDSDIAHAALNVLAWDVQVPEGGIKLKVANGHVTLEGEVDWYFQAAAAERAIRNLTGVRGVSNFIRVVETPAPSDVKQRIKEALKRQAEADAGEIMVETSGHSVTLRGTVRSITEKRDAEYAAWRARGVTRVENQITINPLAPVMA